MKARISISKVSGKVEAPASKSAVQRYIAGALLAEGVSEISATSFCDDSLAALSIAATLGAKVSVSETTILIRGGFAPAGKEIFCGESGLSARMFTPIAALHDRLLKINGKGSLLKRPLDMIERPLAELGATVVSNKGYLPVEITGPLRGGEVTADGSVSSQFITGLLMALPVVPDDSRLYVENLVSRPYIDLTLGILDEFGIKTVNEGYRVFKIKGNQKYIPGKFTAEGDWSGAAFLLVMGALGGEVEVTGLSEHSTQADKAVMQALKKAGADVGVSRQAVKVKKAYLKGFEFDVSECPDLAPPLTVLALACSGKSVISGTERLAAKESDRGKALEQAMNSIGGRVLNLGNRIEIEGGIQLKGGRAGAHNDHRIAMALSASAILSGTGIVVEGMESINKSYPGFIDDLRSLGGNIVPEI